MARVTPLLLSSTSWLLMLSPLVLMLLVASWPTPAVEARFLQAHDEPQWMQEIHASPVDDKEPFEVRLRRSPQEPEQQNPDEKPGFFSSLWTSIKNFASTAFEAVSNFFGGIFGSSSSNRPDTNDATTPKPPGDRKSPESGERGEGSSGHVDDNERSSPPSGKDSVESSTGPKKVDEKSPSSGENPENSETSIDDGIYETSDISGEISSPPSTDIGVPAKDDGRPPMNYHGNGTDPLPNDDRGTTSVSDVPPVTNSAENEIPDN